MSNANVKDLGMDSMDSSEVRQFDDPVLICGSLTMSPVEYAEKLLRDVEIEPLSPSNFVEEEVGKEVMIAVLRCNTVMVLPNWEYSEVARLIMDATILAEKAFINIDLERIATPERNVLRVAENITRGDRNQDYGHAYGDYRCFGKILAAYLTRYYQGIGFLKEYQDLPDICAPVAVVIPTLVKTSRHAHVWTQKDTPVDGAGYWSLVEMVLQKEAELKLLRCKDEEKD